jgi:Rieske Fe-S protein
MSACRDLCTSVACASADRRQFLGCFAAYALGALLPGCASVVAVPVTPENGRIRLLFLHHPVLREPGGFLRVRTAGEPGLIYVLATEDGDFAAVSPICTHQGCTVDVTGTHLVCPCHGSTYDRTGQVVRGPAPRSLARYAVSADPDGLTIDLGGQG